VLELRPVSSTGPFTIVENEISIPAGGVNVTFEILISEWGPPILHTYQADIDSSGYTTATGSLSPLTTPGPEAGAFIDRSRADFVFAGHPIIAAVDRSTLDYRFGATLGARDCVHDDGTRKYGGTLILHVSSGASGVFTVRIKPRPFSLAIRCPGALENLPLELTVKSGTIRINEGIGGIDPCDLFPDLCAARFCESPPPLCDLVDVTELGVIELICWQQPCRLLDPIPKNCLVKWNGCPGCEGGAALCPPFYDIYLEGLEDDWTVRLIDPAGYPVPFHQIPLDQGRVVSFRPSEKYYMDGLIGSYFLAFDLNPKGSIGKRYKVTTKLLGAADVPFSSDSAKTKR